MGKRVIMPQVYFIAGMASSHRSFLGLSGIQTSNPIQKDTGGTAVILVVIQDALFHCWIAHFHPPVKPLDGGCPRPKALGLFCCDTTRAAIQGVLNHLSQSAPKI